MTRQEHLLVVASEECAEICQAVSKTLRFGRYNYDPAVPSITNEFQLMTEYYQLQAVMEMILQEGIIGDLSEETIVEIKSQKKARVSKLADEYCITDVFG